MNLHEWVTLLITIAVLFITWKGQKKLNFIQRESNKIQQEATDLQRATSELAKKQLEILLKEEKGKNLARVSLELIRDGKGYRFKISNISDVDARNVEMELLVDKPGDNPLIKKEYDKSFPVKKLPPGGSIRLNAAIHLGSPTAYNALLRWINPDGSRTDTETFVAL